MSNVPNMTSSIMDKHSNEVYNKAACLECMFRWDSMVESLRRTTNDPRVVSLNPVASQLQFHTYMLTGGQNWHCWLCYSLRKIRIYSPPGDECAFEIHVQNQM